MARASEPALTVLSGSLAGARFPLEEGTREVLIGSGSSCSVYLPVPEVSSTHARLTFSEGGAVVEDLSGGRGVYVNDDRVDGEAALRTGDILWLGQPGADDSVMIQVRLPASAAPPPAPPEEVIPVAPPEAAAPEAEAGVLDDLAVGEPSAASADTVPAAEAAPSAGAPAEESFWFEEPPPAPSPVTEEPRPPAEEAFMADETAASAEPPPEPAAPEPMMDAAGSTEVIEEDSFAFSSEPADTLAVESPPVFEDDLAETIATAPPLPSPPESAAPAPETIAPPPEPEPEPPAPAPVVVPPSASPRPAPAAPAPAPAPPSPRASARTAAASAAASTPEGAARPTERPAARRPPAAAGATARPAPRPRPADRSVVRPAPAPAGGPPIAAIAGGGLVVLLVAGFFAWRALRPAASAPTPAPVSEAAAPPVTAAPEAAPPVVSETMPPAAAAPPTVGAEAVPVAPPPTLAAAPTPAPRAVPTAPPTIPPRAVATAPLRPPVAVSAPGGRPASPPPAAAGRPPAAPAAPAPAALAAPFIAQADAASAARNYDGAIGLYDEALKVDPQNAKAAAGKKSALASREAAKHTFVAGRTTVQSGKEAKGGLAGFDTSGVSVKGQTADFAGRLDLAMEPALLRPGDAYTLRVFVANEAKKEMKLSGLTYTTTVNGKATPGSASPRVKDIAPGQRVMVHEVTGVWPEGVTAWSTDVVANAGKGESLRNRINWK